jgi:hypothetical protein
VYESEVRSMRRFLDWIRAKSESKLVAQMKGDILMLVPEIADEFRTIIRAPRSVESDGVF